MFTQLSTVIGQFTRCLIGTLRGFRRTACFIIACLVAVFSSAVASAQSTTVLRVAESGQVNGDGQSWSTAFRFLQDALAAAAALDPSSEEPVEIWVAQGTYRPDQNKNNKDPDHPNQSMVCDPEFDLDCCPPYGNCSNSPRFEMLDNVRIFGGFDGTEATRDERRPLTNITILSGNLSEFFAAQSTNLVISENNDATTRLDGFHITGAFGGAGGAVVITGSDLILSNCVIRDNLAWWGAAVLIRGGNPQIINCVMHDNVSNTTGGTAHIADSEVHGDVLATMINCLIYDNTASGAGGATGAESTLRATTPLWW